MDRNLMEFTSLTWFLNYILIFFFVLSVLSRYKNVKYNQIINNIVLGVLEVPITDNSTLVHTYFVFTLMNKQQ